MTTPLVSIVLPTYNRSRLLPRAVRSVLAQGFRDFELIVIDDCSNENIRSLVESLSDPRLVYVRRDRNGGAPAARNTGLALARGRYIAFQDSDDEWLNDKLETQVQALEAAPAEVGLVICGMVRHCADKLFIYPAAHLLSGQGDYCRTVQMNPIAFTQTWLLRRELLAAVGTFDERLKIWDDWDLLLRLSAHTCVQFLPRPLVLSHMTLGSLSTDLSARTSDLMHILAKYEAAPDMDPRFLGRLEYLIGRFLFLNGRKAEARTYLWRAATRAGFGPKLPALYALSLCGAPGERLFRRFAGTGKP